MEPVNIFVAYCEQDSRLGRRLDDYLVALHRQGLITSFSSRAIGSDGKYDDGTVTLLNSARIVLVLASAHLLASEFFYGAEMGRLLGRHRDGQVVLTPVLTRECEWKQGYFQSLSALPSGERPVTSRAWKNQDEAFADIARGLREVVKAIRLKEMAGAPVDPAAPVNPGAEMRAVPEGGRIWNIIQPKNVHFTARDQTIQDIRAAFTAGEAPAKTVVIVGLGGVGKTEIAREYAYRYGKDYGLVWWVRAEDATTRASDFADLAGEMGLGLPEDTPVGEKCRAVSRALAGRDSWLLIFDFAWEAAHILPLFPRLGTGHVLVTGQKRDWDNHALTKVVSVWTRPEALEFLRRRAGLAEEDGAAKLVDLLGNLPVALEHAAAYIVNTRVSVNAYLVSFAEEFAELSRRAARYSFHKRTVAITLQMALTKAGAESVAAEHVLNVCAFFAPEYLPRRVVRDGLGLRHLDFEDAVATLLSYSLVEADEDFLSAHRLVQAVTRDSLLTQGRHQEVLAASLDLMARAFPADAWQLASWPECSALLPHAIAVARHAGAYQDMAPHVAFLMNAIGLYMKAIGEFAEAIAYFDQAIQLVSGRSESDGSLLIALVDNLAAAQRAIGNHPKARECCQIALDLIDRLEVTDPMPVITSLNNMGAILEDAEEPGNAGVLYRKALGLLNAVSPGPSMAKATLLNNLGGVSADEGGQGAALAYYQDSLSMTETVGGPTHMNYILTLSNMGGVLRAAGDIRGALEAYERAMTLVEAACGRGHPHAAGILASYGAALQAAGRATEAAGLLHEAMTTTAEFLGEDHPRTRQVREDYELACRDAERPSTGERPAADEGLSEGGYPIGGSLPAAGDGSAAEESVPGVEGGEDYMEAGPSSSAPPPQRIGTEGKQADAEQRITSLEKIGRNRENLRRLVGHLSSRGSVIPFVGAGLSIPLNLPGWTDFLTDQAKNVGAEKLIRARLKAGQYEEAAEDLERAMTAFGLHAAIEECYGDHNIEGKALAGPVMLLPALAKGPVITTNFDRVVERAFADASVPLQPVIAGAKPDLINRMIVKASRGLVKIHGDWEERAARVLKKAEYDEHYGLASAGGIDLTLPLPRLLSHILTGHSLLFVGCSLNRDRTVGTLEKVASVSPEIVHFAILEQPASALKEREKAKFLAEHNILPVWFAPGEYSDIEAILTYLVERM